MKNLLINLCLPAVAIILASCSILTTTVGGLNDVGIGTSRLVKGKYAVQFVECIGNASDQSVTAVLSITNTGPNGYEYIGGSLDGSLAIDNNGYTSKPYNSVGSQYDIPSGATVRVEIPNINPVRPGTPVFQVLRISIGSGKGNMVDFRNVPIVWSY